MTDVQAPLRISGDTDAESEDILEQGPPWGSREALMRKNKDTLKHPRDTGYYKLSSARKRVKVRELVGLPSTLVLLSHIIASHGGAPRFGFYWGGDLRLTSIDRRLNKSMIART